MCVKNLIDNIEMYISTLYMLDKMSRAYLNVNDYN
jgi:hypothetical protein